MIPKEKIIGLVLNREKYIPNANSLYYNKK